MRPKSLKAWIVYIYTCLYNTLYYLKHKDIIVIKAWINQRGDKLFPYNFGDDINFHLVKHLSGKRVINIRDTFITWLPIKNYICIGSVIEWFTDNNSILWGCGASPGTAPLKHKPKMVLAVRGPLTRKYLLSQGVACPEVYGDPGLLMPMMYPCKKEKKYKIGIIPHFLDYNLPNVKELKRKHGDICIIKLWGGELQTIIDKMNECEIIASSSLHGLIISDAYGIPNVWIRLSNEKSGSGGDFKYQDYFASVGRQETVPLDFRNNHDIDISIIADKAKEYKNIVFDATPLLRSCPFIKK